MRSAFTLGLLLVVRTASRILFRYDVGWLGEVPARPFQRIRVLALLNHTSLFEPIFAAAAPIRLLWRIARHGVVPVAQKTAERPIAGRFFKLVARHVVPITRERDDSWEDVLRKIDDPDALVVILPEGRMKRSTGLDLNGQPMTLRGGIADILLVVKSGRLLLAYSGGLHHVHAPGDRFPRFFRKVRLRLEELEIGEYRERLLQEAGAEGFMGAVVEDLTRRRDRCCPEDASRHEAA